MIAQVVVYQEHELRAERLIMVPWARASYFFFCFASAVSPYMSKPRPAHANHLNFLVLSVQ